MTVQENIDRTVLDVVNFTFVLPSVTRVERIHNESSTTQSNLRLHVHETTPLASINIQDELAPPSAKTLSLVADREVEILLDHESNNGRQALLAKPS